MVIHGKLFSSFSLLLYPPGNGEPVPPTGKPEIHHRLKSAFSGRGYVMLVARRVHPRIKLIIACETRFLLEEMTFLGCFCVLGNKFSNIKTIILNPQKLGKNISNKWNPSHLFQTLDLDLDPPDPCRCRQEIGGLEARRPCQVGGGTQGAGERGRHRSGGGRWAVHGQMICRWYQYYTIPRWRRVLYMYKYMYIIYMIYIQL